MTVLSVTAADADFVANIYFAKEYWLDENTRPRRPVLRDDAVLEPGPGL